MSVGHHYLEQRTQAFIDAGWSYHYEIRPSGPHQEVVDWCKEHGIIGEDFTFAGFDFWFKDQKFYNWFILRWS